MQKFYYQRRPNVQFTGVALRDLNNGKWKVIEPFCFRFNVGMDICVHAGYTTDLFSVPRPARWLVPKVLSRGNAAAIVHDYVLSELSNTHSRQLADKIFVAAMKESGIKPWRRILIGSGVKAYTKWERWREWVLGEWT